MLNKIGHIRERNREGTKTRGKGTKRFVKEGEKEAGTGLQ
jgi:hypothetical protein